MTLYLCLDSLSKIFEGRKAVDEVNISIEKGDFVSLVGPSGCGKTTTLKMIGGFLTPDFGSISLDGVDITHMSPEKRPTATVFQSYALFPHMSVFENVAYGLKYRKLTRKSASIMACDMLEKVGLLDVKDSNIVELSGGQQQRVALARALVIKPKLLLLDEPLSNLDAKLRVRMRSEIRKIQKELSITALYVTHDQEEALSMSDRIVVMNDGKIEEHGSPKDIYSKTSNVFVADFMGRSNIIEMGGCLVAVHPEDLLMSWSYSSMRGIILNREFRGAFTTWFIKYGDRVLQVDEASSAKGGWGVGDNVFLSCAPDSMMILDSL